DDFEDLLPQIQNAGSVFCGQYSPESAGDYASGTNHTLPTSGFAKSFSGVSVDSFIKKITFQNLTKKGLENLAPAICKMAEKEGLDAHKNAVLIRINEN
ncbi:MAG: histidinol dehydrogenase, partial [Candidatus Gracilibacteria bacterium]|nr:histidinol dehydrogenase [Candidatus Gracilibacteria bacterium]